MIGRDRSGVFALVLLAVGIALPHVVYSVEAVDVLCFALFAVSLDLLFGYAGLLSFGQALFFGGAGYVVVILMSTFTSIDTILAMVCGVVYAAVAAFLVGLISVRRAGIYFAMITLAIAQIQYFLVVQFNGLTGGENGLQVTSRGSFLGARLESGFAYYYLVLVIVAVCTYLAMRLVRSPFGNVLRAMRENEPRAIALGYRVYRYKLAVFTIAGVVAGIAGALYAVGNRLAGLDMVDWHTSGAVVMMTVLGGFGTILGPIVGAGIFETLEYFVSKTPLGEETDLVMGVIFALCVLLFRRGIVGEILAALARRRHAISPQATPAPPTATEAAS